MATRLTSAGCYPAIVGAWWSAEFIVRELATADDAGLRLIVGGRSAKTLGRLLARAESVDVAGFVAQSCGTEINVRVWRVLKSL